MTSAMIYNIIKPPGCGGDCLSSKCGPLGKQGIWPTWSDEPGSGTLLPDPDHLRVVDETKYFTTQLQRTLSSPIETSDEASEAEAMKNLQAALLFKKKGNVEKANKLFKHALALSPKNPSILNHFGEFLVDMGDDPVEADHLFVKAIGNAQWKKLKHKKFVKLCF